jgi:hypothetical protein
MPNPTPFRLNRSGLLLALISAAFAGQAGAAAGRVDFALGGATVAGADGRERPVTRGAELNSGDVVRTNNGRVQVRMTDGAFISLQPNTEFGIKDYKFDGKTDGSENALYSLFKGAMRTVTGLIGRVNRNRYQVATPTATVGIRGTGGLIQVLNDGSTLVQGTSGIWFLANPSGSIDVPAGVAGIAPADPKEPPKETTQVPAAGPTPPPTEQEYVQGEQRTEDGSPVLTVEGVLTSGSGYSVAAVFTPASSVFAGDGNATANFNTAGQLLDVSFGGEFYKLDTTNGGTHAEFGTDGILAWGRWIGPASVTSSWFEGTSNVTYGPNEGLHYVVGMPTTTMPTTGSATYTLLGATSPTFLDGSGSPGTFAFGSGGGMTVSFFAGGATLNLANAQVTMPTAGMYTMNGGTTICGSTSSFSFSPSVAGDGSNCFCGCSSFVQGFFAGTNADRAGLAYHISDFTASKQIIGAAALKK